MWQINWTTDGHKIWSISQQKETIGPERDQRPTWEAQYKKVSWNTIFLRTPIFWFPIKNYLKGQRRILHTRDDDGLVIFRPPCFLADHLQVAVHDTPLGSFFLVFSNQNMSQKYFSRQEKTFLSVGKGHSKEKMVRAHRKKNPFVFLQKLLFSCSTISQIKVYYSTLPNLKGKNPYSRPNQLTLDPIFGCDGPSIRD